MRRKTYILGVAAVVLAAVWGVGCKKPPTPQQKKLLAAHEAPRTPLEKLKAKAKAEEEALKEKGTNIALEATVELAKTYEKGSKELVLEPDFYRAGLLYKRAAGQGDAYSQNRIGVMFEIGQGLNIVRNYAKAAEWYQQAADQELRDAETNIAFLYEKGRGVEQHHVTAAEYYLQAAQKGEPFAQFHLGLLYELGRGVPRNDADAAKWILLAAESGLIDAQFKLATMYEEGHGVDRNVSEAMRWYERSARQGHIDSQLKIALLRFAGKDVKKDDVEAYKWVNIAAANGSAKARQLRTLFAEGMTKEQIDFAQKRATEFEPKKVETNAARGRDMPL